MFQQVLPSLHSPPLSLCPPRYNGDGDDDDNDDADVNDDDHDDDDDVEADDGDDFDVVDDNDDDGDDEIKPTPLRQQLFSLVTWPAIQLPL